MRTNEMYISRAFDQARSLIEEEKYLHAAQVYLRLLQQEPELLAGYLELSSLYADCGHLSAARLVLTQADVVVHGHPTVVLRLATILINMEEYDKALTQLKRLEGHKLPEVHCTMGVVLDLKNNIKRAEEQFRYALRLDPDFPGLNEHLGEILMKREAHTEAVEVLKRAVILDPYSATGHHLLGVAFSRLYDWRKAYKQFCVAIEMAPDDPLNWQMCGECLMRMNRFADAEPYLQKALELRPDSIEVMIALAHLLSERGEIDRASVHIEKAKLINPAESKRQHWAWRTAFSRKQTSS